MFPTLLRRLTWLAIAAMLAGLSLQGGDRSEYEVKAAFLVNFTHFVEWKAAEPGAPFNFCVIGTDPFGNDLEKAVGSRTVDDRRIVIKRFQRSVDGSACDIAYVGDLDHGTLLRLLPALELSHSLTVGDSLEFARRYGMIGFYLENSRVSLALNTGRASKAGLKINSQLMRVAKAVSNTDKEGRP